MTSLTSMANEDMDLDGLRNLAATMLEAGCEAVVGMTKGGHGLLVVGDGSTPREVAQMMRDYADTIEGLRDEEAQYRVDIDVPD